MSLRTRIFDCIIYVASDERYVMYNLGSVMLYNLILQRII
jgi:hypothetical protein